MSEQKYQRIIIRSELIKDAKKIQRLCGCKTWGAAINLVFALYREQAIADLPKNKNAATASRTTSRQSQSSKLPKLDNSGWVLHKIDEAALDQ